MSEFCFGFCFFTISVNIFIFTGECNERIFRFFFFHFICPMWLSFVFNTSVLLFWCDRCIAVTINFLIFFWRVVTFSLCVGECGYRLYYIQCVIQYRIRIRWVQYMLGSRWIALIGMLFKLHVIHEYMFRISFYAVFSSYSVSFSSVFHSA